MIPVSIKAVFTFYGNDLEALFLDKHICVSIYDSEAQGITRTERFRVGKYLIGRVDSHTGGMPSLAYGKSVKTSQFVAGRGKRDNLLHIRKSIAHIRLAQSPEPSHTFQTVKCSKRRCALRFRERGKIRRQQSIVSRHLHSSVPDIFHDAAESHSKVELHPLSDHKRAKVVLIG